MNIAVRKRFHLSHAIVIRRMKKVVKNPAEWTSFRRVSKEIKEAFVFLWSKF